MSKFKPFQTIEPGDALLRIGLTTFARSNLRQEFPVREQSDYTLVMDSGTDIRLIPNKVDDINFWPVSILSVYQRSGRSVTPNDTICKHETLNRDSVVMNLRHGDPLDADIGSFPVGDNFLDSVFLVIVQGGKSHFFKCGGNHFTFEPEKLILEYGRVGKAALKGLLAQYEEIMTQFPYHEGEDDLVEHKYRSWLLANAVVANFIFTAVSIQA